MEPSNPQPRRSKIDLDVNSKQQKLRERRRKGETRWGAGAKKAKRYEEVCEACGGLGAFRNGVPDVDGRLKCLVCAGDGRRDMDRPICAACRGLGSFHQDIPYFEGSESCRLCGGAGWTTKRACVLCGGVGAFNAVSRLPFPGGSYWCKLCGGTGANDIHKAPCEVCRGFGGFSTDGAPAPQRTVRCQACGGCGTVATHQQEEQQPPVAKPQTPMTLSEALSENSRLRCDLANEKAKREDECASTQRLRAEHKRRIAEFERSKARHIQKLESAVAAAEKRAELAANRLLCVICLERDKTSLHLPCSHLATCGPCTDYILSAKQPPLCPICRAQVDTAVVVNIVT